MQRVLMHRYTVSAPSSMDPQASRCTDRMAQLKSNLSIIFTTVVCIHGFC